MIIVLVNPPLKKNLFSVLCPYLSCDCLYFLSLQYWMLSPLGEIRRDEFCLDYVNHVVMNIECGQNRPSQRWTSGVVSFDKNICRPVAEVE